MIAVDTNILVYAHRREVREHEAAVEILRELCSGTTRWAIAWPSLYEFFSVVTHPRIYREAASTPEQAWRQIEAWTSAPSVALLHEGDDFLECLRPLLARARVRGPIVHDARIAALCLYHGVDELLTRDRDFALFPEVRTRNPFG